jgi:steroid delta-isomerase-like uncharacterized protein
MTEAQQVLKHWREAFNAHDEAGLRSVYREDVVLEAPGDIRLEGRDPTVDYAMNWLHAFPDAVIQVEDEIASDGWVVQRFVFEGTHDDVLTAPIGEIPPTRRHLTGRGVQISRVEQGRIAEDHLYFDQMQVLTQLGLTPEAAISK